jgi:hypothetical protein
VQTRPRRPPVRRQAEHSGPCLPQKLDPCARVPAPGALPYEVGRTTIKRILLAHGIDPAPIRGESMSWATFIKAHLGAIAAADFFTVEVVSWAGLIRYYVLFVMDLASRKVEIAGFTRSPDGLWMDQIARNLLDTEDGFLLGKRYLLLDRDPLYTMEFRAGRGGGGAAPSTEP